MKCLKTREELIGLKVTVALEELGVKEEVRHLREVLFPPQAAEHTYNGGAAPSEAGLVALCCVTSSACMDTLTFT